MAFLFFFKKLACNSCTEGYIVMFTHVLTVCLQIYPLHYSPSSPLFLEKFLNGFLKIVDTMVLIAQAFYCEGFVLLD
jgi:hypothetical protein